MQVSWMTVAIAGLALAAVTVMVVFGRVDLAAAAGGVGVVLTALLPQALRRGP